MEKPCTRRWKFQMLSARAISLANIARFECNYSCAAPVAPWRVKGYLAYFRMLAAIYTAHATARKSSQKKKGKQNS
jgi:hypothetical protein